MPEKSSNTTFDALMRNLKKGVFAPVYLLMGEEAYYIDAVSDYIQNNALTVDEQAFNQTIVFGADTTVGKIIDMASAYPMMAQRRVVIVKEAQALRSIDKLDKYVEKPLASTILVICYKNGNADRRHKWVNAVAREGVLLESKKMKEWQIPAYIQGWVTTHGATAEQKSAEMMAEHIGADLHRLHSELEKLLVMLPENDKRITPEMVEKNVGVSKDFNWFELRDAIASKNIFKANQIMAYMTSATKKDSFFTLLPSMFAFFQNLMLAHYAPNKQDPQAIASALELRSKYGAECYMTAMRNYNAMKTLQILDKIEQTDCKIKGLNNPNTNNEDLMKELLFFILH